MPCVQLSNEIQAIQRTARPEEVHLLTGTAAVAVSTTSPPVVQQAVNRMSPVASNLLDLSNWNCLTCTYNNSGQSSRCEMCGEMSVYDAAVALYHSNFVKLAYKNAHFC
jgi:hypothetical protein